MELQQLVIDGIPVPEKSEALPLDDRLQDLGRSIRSRRQEHGWSQALVAHRAGISPQYLSRIERGKAAPGLRAIYRIAEALGAEPSCLFVR